ncbi:MAG: BatA domain-containing protein, partial [Cyclobacteriaceae bacterium]|nr:BatA domain-containing protein [Cyclobacteriaceae bacterium]
MIQFAQPIFLWALTALAIPIGIHLLSRKEGKVVKMGSLRHLRETSTQQFKGIKLNELLLLALRCLLIILFVGLLA